MIAERTGGSVSLTVITWVQLVELPLGAILYEPGDALRHVHFPIDSIVSLLYVWNS